MGREDPQLKLRLSEDLKDRVAEAARRNNRSVNAEIVHRLEASFAPDETIGEALSGNWTLPENTSDEAIDRAIHNAVAKALRGLGIKRAVEEGPKDA